MTDKTKQFGKFNVRLYEGQRGTEPFGKTLKVEFYDATQDTEKFGPLGQFTGGRYYLTTLEDGYQVGQGLCLQGHVPAWNIDPATYAVIMRWLSPQIDATVEAAIANTAKLEADVKAVRDAAEILLGHDRISFDEYKSMMTAAAEIEMKGDA